MVEILYVSEAAIESNIEHTSGIGWSSIIRTVFVTRASAEGEAAARMGNPGRARANPGHNFSQLDCEIDYFSPNPQLGLTS
ncbi:MAG TPA: hypothetical protein VMI10_00590 [Terriglobales bacterium]|nr:hypothetical protein [Terriglobales bacterium]